MMVDLRPGFCMYMLLMSLAFHSSARAQEGPQPPLYAVPASPLPAAAQSPAQTPVPPQQTPDVLPDNPLPQPDRTTVDVRQLEPLSHQPRSPAQPSSRSVKAADINKRPQAESPSGLRTSIFNLVGPYRAPHIPSFPMDSSTQIDTLVRDGKLYLSLHDAIVLGIQNNLDVEISRYGLLLADTDLTRARGGGSLRGIDYTVQQPPPGVGADTSPLLNTATTTSAASTNVALTDLSQVTQTGGGTQQDLSTNGTAAYSAGPAVPLFDPTLTGQAGYFRRSDQDSLIDLGSSSATTEPLDYFGGAIDYQQGFSTGAQIEAYADNTSQALYSSASQLDPFHAPRTSVTLTQPLMRGASRATNLRFIHIAQLNQKVSRLIFEQQLLQTIDGMSRLYFDLVSLDENVGVQEESLAAAERLYQDDKIQVEQGTLAPIELTRTQALVSSSRLALVQAQGEYRQQEVILREQLLRNLGSSVADFASIVPTDRISVPDAPPVLDVPSLIEDALINRPDLAQAGLQVKANEISVRASRNNVKPLLNVYANVQSRGSSLSSYAVLGSTGNGAVTPSPDIFEGGLRLSTIYQGGVQIQLPLRNRIAQADAARDAIQLRQSQARTAKLENDIRQQIENAAIALETAHQAYAAAVESRDYQQQLLQSERDKFSVGESTNFLIVQDDAYLAQARSTEVAARSDWMKAKISLDRALGNLLSRNGIVLDDAIGGK